MPVVCLRSYETATQQHQLLPVITAQLCLQVDLQKVTLFPGLWTGLNRWEEALQLFATVLQPEWRDRHRNILVVAESDKCRPREYGTGAMNIMYRSPLFFEWLAMWVRIFYKPKNGSPFANSKLQ